MSQPQTIRTLMSLTEAHDKYGVPLNTLAKAVRQGRLIRFQDSYDGRKTLIYEDDVRQLVAERILPFRCAPNASNELAGAA